MATQTEQTPCQEFKKAMFEKRHIYISPDEDPRGQGGYVFNIGEGIIGRVPRDNWYHLEKLDTLSRDPEERKYAQALAVIISERMS